MLEKEIKILEIDKKAVKEKIISIGGKLEKKGIVKTIFFDFPDRRLYKKGDILRIRNFEGEMELTYKKRKKSKFVKKVEEINVKLKDPDSMILILKLLGLKEVLRIRKKREVYGLEKNLKIMIDKIENIPEYMEIEGNEKDIKNIVKKLNLKDKKIVNWDTFELIEYYNQLKF